MHTLTKAEMIRTWQNSEPRTCMHSTVAAQNMENAQIVIQTISHTCCLLQLLATAKHIALKMEGKHCRSLDTESTHCMLSHMPKPHYKLLQTCHQNTVKNAQPLCQRAWVYTIHALPSPTTYTTLKLAATDNRVGQHKMETLMNTQQLASTALQHARQAQALPLVGSSHSSKTHSNTVRAGRPGGCTHVHLDTMCRS